MKKDKEKKHSPARVMRNIRFMLRYVLRYTPSWIAVTLCEAFGRGAWHIIGVFFTKYLFDAIEAGVDFETVLLWTLLVTLYSVIFELFNKWRLEVYTPKAKLILHEGMQSELYKKAREIDLASYDDPDFYNDFIWAIRESDARVSQMMGNFNILINRIVSSIAIWGLLAAVDLIISLLLLVTVGAGFLLKNKLNRIRFERNEEINPIERKRSYIGRVFYLPEYAKQLRQGEIAAHLSKEYGRATEEKIDVIKKYIRTLLPLSFLSLLLTDLIPSLGVTGYLIVRYLIDPTLSLGSFSAALQASFKLSWTIDDIGNHLTLFHEHSLYIEKVRAFIDREVKIGGEICDVPAFEKLSIRNLSFAYPFAKEGEEILHGVNMEIRRGERIAIVGYNGAGKTTLIKLLMRLYDTTSGEILYNGMNIREIDPAAYRAHIGAVFQDYKIFAATVAENVLGGEYTDSSAERVHSALKAASFDQKLSAMEQGIHTELTTEFSKEGVGLSGGEAQKIAIARVFAGDSEIIIMDEPSSALDPIAEYELNRSILEHAEGKTVIFISHRLSTTKIADRIYMFENGTLIECGSHEALMEKNGKYAEMYRVQAKKYRTEM